MQQKRITDLASFGRAIWQLGQGSANRRKVETCERVGSDGSSEFLQKTLKEAHCLSGEKSVADDISHMFVYKALPNSSGVTSADDVVVDSQWAAEYAQLSEVEKCFLSMEVLPDGSDLWGKCTLCNKMFDEKHRNSKYHKKKLSWHDSISSCENGDEKTACQPCLVAHAGGVHKRWPENEKSNAGLDPSMMEMQDYEGGGLWGWCLACDCWVFNQHVASKRHAKNASWYIEEHGGSVGGETRKLHDDFGTHVYVSKVMHGNLIEFRPRGWKGEQAYGVFLVDSFNYMKDDSRGWEEYVEYLPDSLQSLWERTGFVFKAYCCGGAALVKPMGRGVRFVDMLSLVPNGLQVIIPIVCGNDFLGGGGWYVDKYDPKLNEAVQNLCVGMKAKSRRQFAVAGGSSSTWNYKLPSDVNSMYYNNALRLVAAFEVCGVRACTGADELVGIKMWT